jgi:Cof subfamily protein (haloacid dehalogenase superfamily)
MNIRAVCTDIDGTLLDARRELSERTIRVFRTVAAKVPIILASSRMPSAMTHLQRELGIEGNPLITYNGGYVIRYGDDATPRVYDSVFIPVDITASILALVREANVHASLYFEDEWYAPARDQWTEREETITKVNSTIRSADSVLEDWRKRNAGAHKVMCMGERTQIAWLYDQLVEKHNNDIHVYLSRPTYIELAPKQISKGSALKLILEKQYRLSISDCVTFGDNYNDVDMLQMSGRGIAVANARDEVKAIAHQLTGNSVDDGVAMALEQLFL